MSYPTQVVSASRSLRFGGFVFVILLGCSAAPATRGVNVMQARTSQRPAAPSVAAASATPTIAAPTMNARLDPLEALVPYSQPRSVESASTTPRECSRDPLPTESDASCSTAHDARRRLYEILLRASAPTNVAGDAERCPSAYAGELAAISFRRQFYRRATSDKRALDRELAQLEACRGFEPGLIRLLRAHYFAECAVPLANGALQDASVSNDLRWALRGLAVKARISEWRRALQQPSHQLPSTAGMDVVRAQLSPWLAQQRRRLEQASAELAELPDQSYGRGVAALELGGFVADVFDRRSRAVIGLVAPGRPLVELRALLGAENERLLEEAGAAAAFVPLVSDWQQIDSWWLSLHYRYWDAAQSLILPASAVASKLGDERVLLLLPSFVAARLLPVAELGMAELRALELAGLAPQVRRRLSERTADKDVAQLLVRARLKLAVRGFQPQQARASVELVKRIGVDEDALGTIGEVLAGIPEGAATWARAEVLPGAELLLQRVAKADTNLRNRAWLAWDAMLLAGPRATELFTKAPTVGGVDSNMADADAGFRWCQSGGNLEHPCSCPSLRNL